MVHGLTTDAVSHPPARGAHGRTGLPGGGVAAASLDKLRDTANRIVGNVFYGTMLKAMRESTLKGKYGHGGRGEEAFGAQLHQQFAEQMGAATRLPLADSIVKAYERHAGRGERPGMLELVQ